MWSIEQIVGIKRNAEQTTPLDLFLAGMSSVMVTISTCASPYIPTVIIKSISVLLHGAELHSCSYSNSLFVDYWQDTGTCQQHVRETASLSVESHHEGWHFPLYALSLSLSPFFRSRGLSEGLSGDNLKLSVDKRFPDKLGFFCPRPEWRVHDDSMNQTLE